MTGIKFASPEIDVRLASSSLLAAIRQGNHIAFIYQAAPSPWPRWQVLSSTTEDRVMNLPQRPLGSSRVMITRTGFGAWAIGGGGWAFGWGPPRTTPLRLRPCVTHWSAE